MKYAASLCLLISALFLTACSKPPVSECSWTAPIYFDNETKQWLMETDPWPPEAFTDFNKIGDHNELYQLFCN